MPARKKEAEKKTKKPTAKSTATVKKKQAAKSTAAKKKPVSKKTAAAKKKQTGRKSSPRKNLESLPVVGIGASAGGLKALESFFAQMPADSGMAFVVIQHLSPGHKSIMGSLLEKHTAMKVLPARDGTKLKSDCIYLNPPDKNIGILNGTLQLLEPRNSHGTNLPIDYFFRSLAEDQHEKGVCIVLSGTGTDGTLGLKAVKAGGGMTMAQQEADAEYSGMPRSAIDTGMVDYVLPAADMPSRLLKYAQHPYLCEPDVPAGTAKHYDDYVQKIFLNIRSKTGHDFSGYKKNTIYRRIERRMAVHQIERIADYVRLLGENPSEVETLFREMLITVTNFFRDPDAFKILEKKVFSGLLKKRGPDSPLRVWVPGCATGEEAYSVAMLIAETMQRLGVHATVQIFATDIDEEAVEYARAAVYPDSIAADVSPERLKAFFVKDQNSFRIKKQIREMVVFANQSLTKDPPFSKLDMVVCRNVLIYMDTDLQKKVIPLFHYTLIPDGVLFLGSSESIGGFLDFFAPIDTKWKIFKRRKAEMPRVMEYPGSLPDSTAVASDARNEGKIPPVSEVDIRDIAEMAILEKYGPPCVIVNDKYDILYFSGNTDKYLSPPVGLPSFNILKMSHEALHFKLTAALHKVSKQRTTVVCEGLQFKHHDTYITVDLTVMPVTAARARQDLMMVVFEDKTPPEVPVKGVKKTKNKKEDFRLATLEQELQSTREYLQTTIEELETSNEELKSTNEELQSTNEELQSTNEELETSKEEMQSTNEELSTVNAELQSKVDELSRANNDLNNLLASTEIGTIFLDMELNIKRFTPVVEKIFHLIKTDIGRPISDLSAKLVGENVSEDAVQVLRTLNTHEKNVTAESGECFSMRIMPYRTTENVIDGVVITFVDITHIVKAERLAAVVKDSNDAVTLLDPAGRILAWNRGAEQMYGYSEEEALGMNISELIPDNNKKEAVKFMKDMFSEKKIEPYKTRRVGKNGAVLDVLLASTLLRDRSGNPESLAITERVISELEKTK